MACQIPGAVSPRLTFRRKSARSRRLEAATGTARARKLAFAAFLAQRPGSRRRRLLRAESAADGLWRNCRGCEGENTRIVRRPLAGLLGPCLEFLPCRRRRELCLSGHK